MRRIPFLALGLLSMAWGVWLGLVRLGWVLPLPRPDQLILHGPLMIGGFLGTLVGLERAVGFGAAWTYLAPVFTVAGAIVLVVGPPGPAGAALITLGSAVVVGVFAVLLRRHRSLSMAAMAAGALAWFGGNARWLAGGAIYSVVFWWMAFLVLTITGERLELTRFLGRPRGVLASFVSAAALIVAGMVMTVRWSAPGARIAGGGLAVLALWLLRHDMARRAVRQPGLTRFIGVSLLGGYVWLGVGGALAALLGAAVPGPPFDAVLHAVFLGFVMAMIFAHAPIVFPALLGRPLPFRWTAYVPLAVLHLSVAVRLLGDLVEELGRWRAWGGLLNAAALLLFVVNTAASLALTPKNVEQST